MTESAERKRTPRNGKMIPLLLRLRGVLVSTPRQFAMVLLSASILFPIYIMGVTSLKTQDGYLRNPLGLPAPWTLENFSELVRHPEFAKWILNSMVLTGGAVVVSLLVSAPAAFALHRMTFRGRTALLNTIVALLVVPPMVLIVPLFHLWTRIGLINTRVGAILIYIGLLLPLSVYLLHSFFETVPRSIVDAAVIDGCRNDQLLTKIYMPLARPAIITLLVADTIWIWNELLIAVVFLQSDELKTLMAGLTVFRDQYIINIPVTMAGMVVASAPMALLYLLAQRQFVRGMLTGGVK